MEQLFAEIGQYEDLTRQEAKTLAELELQYAELQFSAKPAATRYRSRATTPWSKGPLCCFQSSITNCKICGLRCKNLKRSWIIHQVLTFHPITMQFKQS